MWGAIAMATPAAAAGAGDTAARTFIKQSIARGISILKDKSLSAAERDRQIHDFLAGLLDTKKIGLFALGDARAKASPSDLDAYIKAFKAFMIASYETRLGGYGGQNLKITGVLDHAPGDYVVTSVLVDPTAPNAPDPPQIDFRVLAENGGFAVVDAAVDGIWLGLAQRGDFVGFLSQHNESVPELTAHLKEMTAQFTGAN